MRALVWLTLTMLCGCGDSTVAVCLGDPAFCALTFRPVAIPGPDQTVASGDIVTLDGANSRGDIRSYSWAQTGGPTVALTNADKARATFVAPRVTSATGLTFQLTVVDRAQRADTGTTSVTVQPPVTVALARATELLAGPLQPQIVATAQLSTTADCPSATADLRPAAAAAQIGLWLSARTIAIGSGTEVDDPSAFLDAARVLVAQRVVTRDVAGQIESFGFALLGGLVRERDPALHEAILEHLRDAVLPRRAAALLTGQAEVRHVAGITIEAVDPAVMQRPVAVLLSSRGRCVDVAQALDLTAASLRVIAAPVPLPTDE